MRAMAPGPSLSSNDGQAPRPRPRSSRNLATGVASWLVASARVGVVLLDGRIHGVAALLVRATGVALLALTARAALVTLLTLARVLVLALLALLAALTLLILLTLALLALALLVLALLVLLVLLVLTLLVLLVLLGLFARGIRCHEVLLRVWNGSRRSVDRACTHSASCVPGACRSAVSSGARDRAHHHPLPGFRVGLEGHEQGVRRIGQRWPCHQDQQRGERDQQQNDQHPCDERTGPRVWLLHACTSGPEAQGACAGVAASPPWARCGGSCPVVAIDIGGQEPGWLAMSRWPPSRGSAK